MSKRVATPAPKTNVCGNICFQGGVYARPSMAGRGDRMAVRRARVRRGVSRDGHELPGAAEPARRPPKRPGPGPSFLGRRGDVPGRLRHPVEGSPGGSAGPEAPSFHPAATSGPVGRQHGSRTSSTDPGPSRVSRRRRRFRPRPSANPPRSAPLRHRPALRDRPGPRPGSCRGHLRGFRSASPS